LLVSTWPVETPTGHAVIIVTKSHALARRAADRPHAAFLTFADSSVPPFMIKKSSSQPYHGGLTSAQARRVVADIDGVVEVIALTIAEFIPRLAPIYQNLSVHAKCPSITSWYFLA
jgi:hypothetical protein